MAGESYCSIAIVSGKGGVGKTTIATNLAWLVHTSGARVAIIDLDLQNQGCTGLMAARYTLADSDALSFLRSSPDSPRESVILTEIEPALYFLPATPGWRTPGYDSEICAPPDGLRGRLADLMSDLRSDYSIDCFVLDCHGGIDGVSIAAAGICDITLAITEADSVSFAGTLALIDSYYSHYADSDSRPRVEYIVNRIPPRYRWAELNKLYADVLSRRFGEYTPSRRVLTYIPSESYVSESFGDYPFQVQLGPKTIFTRKLELTVFSMLEEKWPHLVPERIRTQYSRDKFRERIARTMSSLEWANITTVLKAFTVYSLAALIVFPAFIAATVWRRDASPTVLQLLLVLALSTMILVAGYSLKALCGITRYYRQRLQFHRALLRVLPQEQVVWRRLSICELTSVVWALYLGILVWVLAVCAWGFALKHVIEDAPHRHHRRHACGVRADPSPPPEALGRETLHVALSGGRISISHETNGVYLVHGIVRFSRKNSGMPYIGNDHRAGHSPHHDYA